MGTKGTASQGQSKQRVLQHWRDMWAGLVHPPSILRAPLITAVTCNTTTKQVSS